MHNAGFAALGLDAVYVPLETRDADELRAVRGASSGCAALSVTIAVQAGRPAAASTTSPPTAQRGGRRQHASAHRAHGPLDRLEHRRGRVPRRRSRARGVDAARAARGACSAPAARRAASGWRSRARARASRSAARRAGARPTRVARGRRRRRRRVAAAAAAWDLLVNATPVGSRGRCRASPCRRPPFDGRLVYDLVYDPDPTRVDAAARARRAPRRSAASRCSSRRPTGSSNGGPASGRRPDSFRRRRRGRLTARGSSTGRRRL